MQVKNVSNRGWNVGGITIAPGASAEVECNEADIKDNADLEIVKAVLEDEDKGMTKAEIVAALKEKNVEFDPASKKADLQALLDAAE